MEPLDEQRGSITALYLVNLDIDILVVVHKSIYLLLFSKPVQVSSRVMRSCMFFSVISASLGLSGFIIVCLSARPFNGLVGEADYPP